MAQEREAYYLAADPGTHTGWAMWDKNGDFIKMGTSHSDESLHELLESLDRTIRVVIIEDYTLWKHKADAQIGSRMPAPKAIAILQTFARLWRARIVLQPSHIKPNAEKLTGMRTKDPKTGKKIPKAQTHVIDAYNHGEYYLRKNGIKEHVL